MNKQKQQIPVEDLKISDIPKRQSLIAYLVAAMLITLLLGMISITNVSAYLPGLVVKALQIITFMGLGILYLFFVNKHTSLFHAKSRFPFNNHIIFSISVGVLMSIVLMLLYLFTNAAMIGMSFSSSCSFLLPLVVQEAWRTFTQFPEKRYKLWYNSDVVMDNRTTVFLNSLPIRLRLSMKYFDITDELFEVTVPGHTQFGKFFNQFIIEKNKNNAPVIECIDLEKKPFGWQFYVERYGGLGKQYIDPELSLRENRVKDHSIITAKRQRTEETLTDNLPVAGITERKTISQQINRTTTKINKHEAGQ